MGKQCIRGLVMIIDGVSASLCLWMGDMIMSRKSKARKKQLRREAKKRPKWHICAFVREGCSLCPHAKLHLVVPYTGVLACGSVCAHHDMPTHCVRTDKGPKVEENLDS